MSTPRSPDVPTPESEVEEKSRKENLVDTPLKLLRVLYRLLESEHPSQDISGEALEGTRHVGRDKVSVWTLAFSNKANDFFSKHNAIEDVLLVNLQWFNRIFRPQRKNIFGEADPGFASRVFRSHMNSGFFTHSEIATYLQRAGEEEKRGLLDSAYFIDPDELSLGKPPNADPELISNRGCFNFQEHLPSIPDLSLPNLVERVITENLLKQCLIILEKTRGIRQSDGTIKWDGVGPLPLPIGEVKIAVRIGNVEHPLTINIDGKQLRSVLDHILQNDDLTIYQDDLLFVRKHILAQVSQLLISGKTKGSRVITPNEVKQAYSRDAYKDIEQKPVNAFSINILPEKIMEGGATVRPATSLTNSWQNWSTTDLYINQGGQLIARGQNFAHPMIDGREAEIFFTNADPGLALIQKHLNESDKQVNAVANPAVTIREVTNFAESETLRNLQENVPDIFAETVIPSEIVTELRRRHKELINHLLSNPALLRDKIMPFVWQRQYLRTLLLKPEENREKISSEIRQIFSFNTFLSLTLASLLNLQGELLVLNAYGRVNPALMGIPRVLEEYLRRGGELSEQELGEVAISILMSASIVREEKKLAQDKMYPGTTAFRLSTVSGPNEKLLDFLSSIVIPWKQQALQENKAQISFLSGVKDLIFQGALAKRYPATAAVHEYKGPNGSSFRVNVRSRREDQVRTPLPSLSAEKIQARCEALFAILENYFNTSSNSATS